MLVKKRKNFPEKGKNFPALVLRSGSTFQEYKNRVFIIYHDRIFGVVLARVAFLGGVGWVGIKKPQAVKPGAIYRGFV